MSIRDRIRELRRVCASELLPNPNNWRTHPQSQRNALLGVLNEIGYADALLARELPDGRLMLIDGHLRQETTPDDIVPVLIIDVEEEADKLLALHDPLAAMDEVDQEKLDAILDKFQTDDLSLQILINDLASQAGRYAENGAPLSENDPRAAWEGMPEFESADKRGIILTVHFETAADRDNFAIAIGQELTDKTKAIWYPYQPRQRFMDENYVA